MQRGSDTSSNGDYEDDSSPIWNGTTMDTAAFLQSQGFGREAERSVSVSSLLGSGLGLGSGAGPSYRSIAVAPQMFRSAAPAAAARPMAAPEMFARPGFMGMDAQRCAPLPFQAPAKATFQSLGIEERGLASGLTDSDMGSGIRAPLFDTRPQPPLLGARVLKVAGSYDSIMARIKDFAIQQNVFDLKIQQKIAHVEGAWNSERHLADAEFTIKVYEVQDNQHALEIVRRGGSGFAFNEFMENVQRVIGTATPAGQLPFLGEPDDEQEDIDDEILEEWAMILRDGMPEVQEFEVQVIAKTAAQDNCDLMWQGSRGDAFVAALVDSLTKSDNRCVVRHSKVAIQRLLAKGLELSPAAKAAVDRKIKELEARN